MKILISSLLSLTLLLAACTSSPTSTEIVSSSTEESSNVQAESTASENSNQTQSSREAVVSEIENDVTFQVDLNSEASSASEGMVIPIGGVLQTGDNSRARLDLNPDGTILRLGPNSAFKLPELTEENGEPKTTVQLFFGKIFVLLNGGSLDVETPSGVASVRGSLLSVQYDPTTNRVRASCLEGHCGLENEEGEEIELTEGESVFVDEEGDLSDVTEIDQDEIYDWLEENPELDEFLEELPNPEEYTDYPDDEWYIEWEWELPTEEYPTQEFPTEEFPTEEFPTEEPSTEEAPTEEPPAEEPPPSEEPPSEDPPPDDGGGEGG